SRRRHTRSKRDWSSDVCSSDLVAGNHALAEDVVELGRGVALELLGHGAVAVAAVLPQLLDDAKLLDIPGDRRLGGGKAAGLQLQIGRASCREREKVAGRAWEAN